MMKRNNTRLCASAAIAAALALPFAPLVAQAAAPAAGTSAPVLVIPQTTAPPAPAQTIVLPTELPEPAPPETTVTAPEPATSATRTTTTRTERAAAPAPAPRARAAAPADPAPAPVAEEVEPAVSAVPADTAEPIAPLAASEPVAVETPARNDNALQFGIAVIAAIAALVLAIWGFIAIGRRRSADRQAAMIIERPVVERREPVAAEPVEVASPSPAPSVSPLRPATPAPSMAHSGAAVPLPSQMPATFEERDALLKRMIAAKPDRANPFTSPVQRRKRARLILQSLGRDFGDQEPRIDLSQYPANWPEQARRNNAAA